MKANTHFKIQLVFLAVIMGALVYLLISISKIKEIDESIRKLEQRGLELIEALKKFEEEKSIEEQKRLDVIEDLERQELEEIDKMLNN